MTDLFKLSDDELGSMYRATRVEISRRQEALKLDDVAIIRGCEAAKRAITIAAAGNHTMLFVGCQSSGKSMLRALAHKLGVVSFEALPCPCGHVTELKMPCYCETDEITKHLSRIADQDINIQTSFSSQFENENPHQLSFRDLKRRIDEASKYESLNLDEESSSLLKAVFKELNFGIDLKNKTIQLARTIANLDHREFINSSDIAEAVQYRPLQICSYRRQ